MQFLLLFWVCMGGDILIIITRQGKFLIPEEIHKVNSHKIIRRFFVKNLCDISLTYRMHLSFDDGSDSYFILDSDVKNGGTELVWDMSAHQLLKSGIVKMQIKASNGSGEVFSSEIIEFFLHTYVEFLDVKVA